MMDDCKCNNETEAFVKTYVVTYADMFKKTVKKSVVSAHTCRNAAMQYLEKCEPEVYKFVDKYVIKEGILELDNAIEKFGGVIQVVKVRI